MGRGSCQPPGPAARAYGRPVRDGELATILRDAAAGRPPPADGSVTVLAQPPGPVAGILAFAAHHVVAADVDPAWVHARLPAGDLSAPLGSSFVGALTERLGVAPDNVDLVLVGTGTGAGVGHWLRPAGDDLADHPRVARSAAYRTDGRAFRTEDGAALLVVAKGLAGRWEAAFEVEEQARGRGLGRRLVAAALDVVPAGEPLFVSVAPGNVPSVRAVLATGAFSPIGAELLFPVGRRAPGG
jgi:GNAT superfamily N-acetyltransferase